MITNLPIPQENKETALISKKIYYQFVHKKVTIEQFNENCALASLEFGFSELSPHKFPERPQELLEYDRQSNENKRLVMPDFWRQTNVFNYIAEVDRVKNHNASVLEWLNKMAGYLPKNHPGQLRIKNRVEEFGVTDQIIKDAYEVFKN